MIIKYRLLQLYTFIHSMWLGFTRKDKYYIDEDIYQSIKKIAQLAYPGEELDYYSCDSLEEWLYLIGCKKSEIYCITGDTWYLIAIRKFHRVMLEDFASSTKRCFDIPNVFSTLISLFSNKQVYAKCRETTSYQLIRFYARRGAYTILQDEVYVDGNENYHRIVISANK